ncbi:MAG: RNA polymerase sporulation sigma factor SigG [Firmicutes bacterium]|nr:RNA polymerase sporulation sigma factor SigG [Bacillota bacterium]
MALNKVEICGVNTSKLPILSNEEKKELFEKIQQGDEEAKQKYIYGNLRLVLSVIQKFGSRGESDDIFQVGVIGLIKAINNFDVTQNVKFSTYAVPMIIGEVRRYLRDYNPIRVSRSLRDTAYKALQAKERLTALHQKEPTLEEISKEIGTSKEEITQALDAIQDPVSLFEPVYHDGTDTLFVMDQVSDSKNSDDMWLENISLNEAIRRLNDREKNIINLRFFNGKTQMEVAEEIGISQAQVSRLEKSALKNIRKYM